MCVPYFSWRNNGMLRQADAGTDRKPYPVSSPATWSGLQVATVLLFVAFDVADGIGDSFEVGELIVRDFDAEFVLSLDSDLHHG